MLHELIVCTQEGEALNRFMPREPEPQVSLCHGISTGLYYRCRDQVFENADRVFEKKGQGSEAVSELEAERSAAPRPVAVYRVTSKERATVVAFKLKHPELRHWPLAWTMIDEDVAYLSPSSVYRIQDEERLVAPWERGKR